MRLFRHARLLIVPLVVGAVGFSVQGDEAPQPILMSEVMVAGMDSPWVGGNIVSPPFADWGPEAEATFLEENGHSSYPAEIHYDLGLYFYEQGLYDLSLMHYRKAVEIDPGFPEAYFGIGLLFYSLGDDENAIRYYRQSLEHDPGDADTRNNLGLIYYRRDQLDLAETEIQEAIRLQPNFPDACYNLGLVRYRQENLEAAVTCFLQALSQDPDYHRARFNLGVAYFDLGRLDLAEQQWEILVGAAPGTPLADQAAEGLLILQAQISP
jgi:tetratricopeptide (TPR) repeat protein